MSVGPVQGPGAPGRFAPLGRASADAQRPSAELLRAELESKRSRVIGDIVDISLERMAAAREQREAEDEARRREARANELERQELEAQMESERRRTRLLEALARDSSEAG